ncbi:MAG: AgmX/PglI C-terminal domain-containing protein [Myxococcota bacterium]
MKAPNPRLLALLIATGFFLVGQSAFAQTDIYDWPSSEYPVVVSSNGNLIFIDNKGEPKRAYDWKAQKRGEREKAVYFVNMDKDGGPEIVGAGTPTFVLNQDANAIWSHKDGCDQAIVADFVADDKLDIMCNNGRELKVYTYDGQFVWSLGLNRRIEHCRAGDWNGDLKADLECSYRGSSELARIDAEGELIDGEASKQEIPDDANSLDEVSPAGKSMLDGKEHFDLDGDGNADERLTADGKAVVIGSKAKSKALARIELGGEAVGAVVKRMGDAGTHAFVVTDDKIVVIGPDAKKKAEYSTDANRYKRSPLAELKSVYANDFGEGNNQKAQDAVTAVQDKLSACYGSRVRSNPFAGTGKMLLQVSVDDKGNVKSVNRVHADITDKSILNCAMNALERADYPNAEGGNGSINVNINYTFVDEAR